MNQGVHNVDLLLSFLGRPVEVSAQMALLAHRSIEVEDSVVAAIRFESGLSHRYTRQPPHIQVSQHACT